MFCASPAGTGTVIATYHQDAIGRTVKVQPPGGLAARLTEYDSHGQIAATGVDMNGDGILGRASSDPVTEVSTEWVKIEDKWWEQTTQRQAVANGSATEWITRISRRHTSGQVSTEVVMEPDGTQKKKKMPGIQ